MSFRFFVRLLSLLASCSTLAIALASCSVMVDVSQKTLITATARTPLLRPITRSITRRQMARKQTYSLERPLVHGHHVAPHGLCR